MKLSIHLKPGRRILAMMAMWLPPWTNDVGAATNQTNVGKDAFHRVPDFSGEASDAVERVPTTVTNAVAPATNSYIVTLRREADQDGCAKAFSVQRHHIFRHALLPAGTHGDAVRHCKFTFQKFNQQMKTKILLLTLLATVPAVSSHAQTSNAPAAPKPNNVEVVIDGVAGFQDTPMQPDGKWHVHDPARPQPPIVTPGTFSENAKPPADAIVLFDGTDLSHWRNQRTGGEPSWKNVDGVMISAKDYIQTTNQFGDIQLHLEFREPTPPKGDGQGRGNSGVFFMGQYEIQVLDCYNNKTYADGATGGIYGQHPALANACRPPGEWQTYDIVFNVPHFGPNGEVVTPAYFTVIHNGVVVQNHQAARGATNWKSPGKYTPHGPTGPIALQDHNNPVSFRNIWVRAVPVVNEP